MGVVAALFERTRTGFGSVVDVSIHRAALEWSMFPATADLAGACYNIYETADGQWLALGALESKFWKGFCERIERPDLIPLQYAPEPEHDRVLHEVRAVIRTRSRAEWLQRFGGDDVCLTTVSTPEEAIADPHVRATPQAAGGGRAPGLGADTDAVLEQAGIDAAARGTLRAAGVI
jgi:crotonobetainyl-CoA:carnitine CoA-transferase CaiB-like acyl-CoA transferase